MTIEISKKEPLNIVPFIDIMLVLLAMVLSVSSSSQRARFRLRCPSREARRLPSRIRTRSSSR